MSALRHLEQHLHSQLAVSTVTRSFDGGVVGDNIWHQPLLWHLAQQLHGQLPLSTDVAPPWSIHTVAVAPAIVSVSTIALAFVIATPYSPALI